MPTDYLIRAYVSGKLHIEAWETEYVAIRRKFRLESAGCKVDLFKLRDDGSLERI